MRELGKKLRGGSIIALHEILKELPWRPPAAFRELGVSLRQLATASPLGDVFARALRLVGALEAPKGSEAFVVEIMQT